MPSTLAAYCLLVSLVYCAANNVNTTSEKYKFLYYTSFTGSSHHGPSTLGSHYATLTKSAKALVEDGHQVVVLKSSENVDMAALKDTEFSFRVFQSSFRAQSKAEFIEFISALFLKGGQMSSLSAVLEWVKGNIPDFLMDRYGGFKDCDDLLGDTPTLEKLKKDNFDMLVGDDDDDCVPLLAQALNIPFVMICIPTTDPERRQYVPPTDLSYMPEDYSGLPDKMTFFQRVENVLLNHIHYFLARQTFSRFDELKMKYNIMPDINTMESKKQAKLVFFHGSYGLEFPRPMMPNSVLVLHGVGLDSGQKIERGIAGFLDTAPNGVVLFSFGSFLSMQHDTAQVLADGFALLEQRVLWQANGNLSGVRLANNTMVVDWLPLPKVMEHRNVKIYVTHGGAPSMNEALWAGLPIVAIPMFADQIDNVIRLVDRGAGISLDIVSITAETLSKAINEVLNESKYRENAQRISMIMKDLQTDTPPVKTVVHWILHVTRFGGDHLRPALHDLNPLQRSLLDVYLFIFAVLASIIGFWVSVIWVCCKCVCRKGHPKQD